MADLLDAPPGLVGVAAAPRLVAQLLAGLGDPRVAAALDDAAPQPVVQLEQVRDVGGGVAQLRLAERATQPVGEAVRLRQSHAELAVEQRGERRRGVAEEACLELGVDELAGDRATRAFEDLEILAGGVHDGEPRPLEHLGQRGEVDLEGVDEHDAVLVGDLHQGDVGEVRPLAVELGVHRVALLFDETLDDLGERGIVLDQGAVASCHRLKRVPDRTPWIVRTPPTPWCLRRR